MARPKGKNGLVFKTFGRSRRTFISHEDICRHVQNVFGSSSQDVWGDLCNALNVPNNPTNRFRMKRAYEMKVSDGDESGMVAAVEPDNNFLQNLVPEEGGEQRVPGARNGNGHVQEDAVLDNTLEREDPQDDIQADSEPESQNDEDDFFVQNLPSAPSSFCIPRFAWNTLRKTQKKDAFQGLQWTNVISRGIRKSNPYCSFAFVRHRVKVQGSKRMTPIFKCWGYCMFNDCPTEVEVIVHTETTLRAHVSFRSNILVHSKKELRRRPIRAGHQIRLHQQMETGLPRAFYLHKLAKLRPSVVESGCRDEAPSPGVLKSLSWRQRRNERRHRNEMLSLQQMLEEKTKEPEEVLQKVLLHPKGVMLWSRKSINIFHHRSKEDIVYLDATGSILRKSKNSTGPFYVYELVVRNPKKGGSPFPVATYITCDHTTASILYFLSAFQTDHAQQHGHANVKPLMVICDGSMVLMQAISLAFCQTNLNGLIKGYYNILTGNGTAEDFSYPILHRCLSHIMRNARTFCKKHAPKNYKLAMHVFGLLSSAETLVDFEQILHSCTVIFSSPCSSGNVEKHFHKIQTMLLHIGDLTTDTSMVCEDNEDALGPTPFRTHFRNIIASAALDKEGDANVYYSGTFMPALASSFLPHAALWTRMMLGDLGRHGEGLPYQQYSKHYSKISQSKNQNLTQDNKTQGIMEKSQWDLKAIRFKGRRLTRLDDFVKIYKDGHTALLREFADSGRTTKKHRILKERWGKPRQRKSGIYVKAITKPFSFIQREPEVTSVVAKHKRQPDGPAAADDHTQPEKKRRSILEDRRQKDFGPVWRKLLPTEILKTSKLNRPVNIQQERLLSILHPHTWLSSDEIDAACYHLAQKFPGMDGFQSCLCFEALEQGGVVGTPQGQFVQVLHVDGNHWITTSNIFCGPSEVCIYDSLNKTVSKTTEQKLSWLLRPHAAQFAIRRPAVQLQQSTSSCGLFAVAFASVLCEGIRPEDCNFLEKDMRRTLYSALQRKHAPGFRYTFKKPEPERDAVKVDVHCICRTSHSCEVMVQCSTCSLWYHPNCVAVPPTALTTEEENWSCVKCTN